MCQITATTPNTRFYTASDNGTDPNEFGSLEWRISNPSQEAVHWLVALEQLMRPLVI